MAYNTPDTPAIYCPKCKARGPIDAIRQIIQTRSLTDDEGEDIASYTEWEYANLVRRGCQLNCGACGWSWHTRRDLAVLGEV